MNAGHVLSLSSIKPFVGISDIFVNDLRLDSENVESLNLLGVVSIRTIIFYISRHRLFLVTFQVAVLYMSTRLFVNLSQVYLPLWLQDNLQLGATSVATTPLALFVSGFLTSLAMGPLTQIVGRKVKKNIMKLDVVFSLFFFSLDGVQCLLKLSAFFLRNLTVITS